MDRLPDRDWARNGDPEYEKRVRGVLAAMPPIESREDAAACFERLIAEKLIRARDLDTQPFRFFLCHHGGRTRVRSAASPSRRAVTG